MVHHRKDSAGFSAIELIAILTVLGIISVTAVTAEFGWMEGWRYASVRQDLMSEASVALNRMVREIRGIKDRASVITATASRLNFTDTSGNPLDYNYVGTDLMRNTEVLAGNVTAFRFRYFHHNIANPVPPVVTDILERDPGIAGQVETGTFTNIRLVTIEITLTRNGETVSLRTGVAPTNLQFE